MKVKSTFMNINNYIKQLVEFAMMRNKVKLSVVVAFRSVFLLKRLINSLINNDSIEFVIGYDNTVIKNDELKLFLEEIQITSDKIHFIECKKIPGKYETMLSNNEVYLHCLKYTNSDNILFTSDIFEYSPNFNKNIIEFINNDNVAEVIVTDYGIRWADGKVAVYHTESELIDDGVLTRSNVSPVSLLFKKYEQWWLTSLENKIFKKTFISECYSEIESYYYSNSAHFEVDDLLISTVIFSKVNKIIFEKKIFSILNWKDMDKDISNFYSDINVNYFINEINNAYAYISKKLNDNTADPELIENFEIFVKNYIGRIVWRHGWIDARFEDYVMKIFPDFERFDLTSFGKFGEQLTLLSDDDSSLVAEEKINRDLKIKVFVSMHKDSFYPKNSKFIEPIQVGTTIADKCLPNISHDNDYEDNISDKNLMYCELTSQYHAWKNVKNLDYYGFWHYRRYFSFNDEECNNDYEIIYHDTLNDKALTYSNINDDSILKICSKYDIVLPRKTLLKENNKIYTVYEQWCNHFNKDDMDITIDVITEKYPIYLKALMEVLKSNSAVFCNMFIMNKEHFYKYNEFCFGVLSEVEKRIDQSKYNVEQYRTLGHIAERLLAVYVTYVEKYSKEYSRIFYTLKLQYNDTRPYASVEHPLLDKCVSIMLACDDKYMLYTNVLLESIRANASQKYNYDIVICHRDISVQNQSIAKSIFSKSNNILLRFADVTRNFEKYSSVHIDRHLTLETYYRFLVLDVFKGYERVLYLDCDMVVNSDPAELFFTEMDDDEYIGAVRDYDFIAAAISKDVDFYNEKILKHVKIDSPENYFQAGMILFNLKSMSKVLTSEKLFETALSRNWFFHDQDVLNCLLNGHIKYVDDKWNVFSLLEKNSRRSDLLYNHLPSRFINSYKKSLENPSIIHYAGVPKVWHDASIHLGYLFWKYARNSPFYEKLNDVLLHGEGDRSGWIIFINSEPEKNPPVHFFSVRSIKEPWVSNYCVIDFVFMSNHSNIMTNTLTINYSLFPHDKYGVWTKIIDFKWEKEISEFNKIFYEIHDDKSPGLDIYLKPLKQYEGFSFKIRELSSRCLNKPYIQIINQGYYV